MSIPVYLEAGRRRVFAGAIEWPGWCRSGRDADSALEALIASGPRYAAALGRAARGFEPPASARFLEVVERLEGNATTDFGAPAIPPAADGRPLEGSEPERLQTLLRACWSVFDAAADAAVGSPLRKGPRGGGRELDAIVSHVAEAERAYLSKLGGTSPRAANADATEVLRRAIIQTLSARAAGQPVPDTKRSRTSWTPRYFVRRSAWHVLDHMWEIHDRAMSPAPE